MGCVGSPTDVHWGKRRAVAPPGRRLTVGRGVALSLSVPLPSLGRQQSGRHWRCAVHGGRGPPYHSGSCSPSLSGYDLCGVPVRRRGPVCSSRPPCGPAAGAGGAGHTPAPLSGGGAHSPCLGGGVALRPPRSRSGRRPVVPLSGPPLRRARAVGADVPPRGGGGVRGGPWTAPLGAPADLQTPPPSPRSGLWSREGHVGRGLLRAPLCALLRHAGLGPWGQVQPPPPLPCRRSSCGWGRPPGPGGAEGRACGSPAGVGAGGGGGGHPACSRACVGGGGGGEWGGVLRFPGDAPCRPKKKKKKKKKKKGGGGGLAVPAPGGRALPPPPSTECRILPQSLPGAPHFPAVAARRWPAGGGREGQRSVVSGLRGRLPWVGNKAGVPWRRAVHGGRGHPYHSGSRPPGFSGHDLRGVPVRRRGPTCSSRPPLEPAAGASGRVTLRLPSRAGGSVPSASGGGGRGPCGRRAGGGAGGGGGGCRAAASLLSFQAAACGTPSRLSPCRRCSPFRRALAVGAEVPPRGGGGEGRPVDRPPGGLI